MEENNKNNDISNNDEDKNSVLEENIKNNDNNNNKNNEDDIDEENNKEDIEENNNPAIQEENNPTTTNNNQLAREEAPVIQGLTCSGRISRFGAKLTAFQLYQFFDNQIKYKNLNEYNDKEAKIIAMILCQIIDNFPIEYMFVQQYSINKAIEKWGEPTKKAAFREMKQLRDRKVFEPINLNKLTDKERKAAMKSLLFIVQKRDELLKARTCANTIRG